MTRFNVSPKNFDPTGRIISSSDTIIVSGVPQPIASQGNTPVLLTTNAGMNTVITFA